MEGLDLASVLQLYLVYCKKVWVEGSQILNVFQGLIMLGLTCMITHEEDSTKPLEKIAHQRGNISFFVTLDTSSASALSVGAVHVERKNCICQVLSTTLICQCLQNPPVINLNWPPLAGTCIGNIFMTQRYVNIMLVMNMTICI